MKNKNNFVDPIRIPWVGIGIIILLVAMIPIWPMTGNWFGVPAWAVFELLINVLTSCLSGMLGALIIILIFREISPKPIIASVDVANIIRDQSKQIKNKDEAIKAAKTLSVNLQSTLEGLSSQFNMIILNKNAVYSGVPDYTLEVSQRLKSLSVD